MRSLPGTTAALTGAAGGIGTALARQFAASGCHLALCDVDGPALERLADDLRTHGRRVTTHVVDVRDREAMGRWADAVEEAHGGLDLLINNAGVTSWGLFAEQDPADVAWVMDVDVRGVMNGCHAFLPLLQKSADGHIVNMSSMIALMGIPMQSTYTAAKWAVRGFSRALRVELCAAEIGVTTVMPGAIATPFLQNARTDDAGGTTLMTRLMLDYGTSPEWVARRVQRAVLANRSEIRVGWDSHLVWATQTFAPGLLPWLFRFSFRRFTPDGKLGVPVEPE
jgi:short-subunit dehydrogenase